MRTEIGARGQDDRHPRAEHDAGRVGLRQEVEVLGEHVAGFEIGHDQDLRLPRDRGLDALDPRRLGIDRVVEGERSVEHAAGDLAAVGHLAERRGLDGRGDLWCDRFDRGQDRDPRRAKADLGEEIDGVLHDVALGVEIGSDVDCRIGDEQRVRMGRHVHDEHMADPPRGAQAGRRGRNGPHQFIGVQAALHQQFAFGLVNELNAFRRRGIAVRHVDDLEASNVNAELLRGRRDLARRSDQNGHDDPGGGGVDRRRAAMSHRRDAPRWWLQAESPAPAQSGARICFQAHAPWGQAQPPD